jgi:two-component system OmpR family response regulator
VPCQQIRMADRLRESSECVRPLVAEILEDEGFDTCSAATSDQAAHLIENPAKTFRLLVTDVDLPGGRNDIGLAQLTHRYYPSLPVLFMTGRPDKVGLLGPNEALLAKPFFIRDLLDAVRQLLKEQPLPHSPEAAW